MNTIRRMAVGVVLMAAPAVFGQAYLVPEGDCGEVTFQATRGADFPNLGERIGADRVTLAYVYLPKRRVDMTPAAGASSFDMKATVGRADGVVMAAFDLAPEVHGNETRTEHAKTMAFCGPTTPIAEWQRETGIGLEIFPQGWNGLRPQLKVGDPMRFIAVDKAERQLLRDIPMELYRAGGGLIASGTPDRLGGMDFPYPAPGRYMVKTTYRRPNPRHPEMWLVDTSTLTFEIK